MRLPGRPSATTQAPTCWSAVPDLLGRRSSAAPLSRAVEQRAMYGQRRAVRPRRALKQRALSDERAGGGSQVRVRSEERVRCSQAADGTAARHDGVLQERWIQRCCPGASA